MTDSEDTDSTVSLVISSEDDNEDVLDMEEGETFSGYETSEEPLEDLDVSNVVLVANEPFLHPNVCIIESYFLNAGCRYCFSCFNEHGIIDPFYDVNCVSNHLITTLFNYFDLGNHKNCDNCHRELYIILFNYSCPVCFTPPPTLPLLL